MKIYKIAAEQFQLIPQDTSPNQQNNPDTQLQNLQNSQQALQYLMNVMQTASELNAKIADLDDALEQDTGLRSMVQQKVNQVIAQSPAYNMLSKMGFMANPADLSNAAKMSQITVQLQHNINYYSQGQ